MHDFPLQFYTPFFEFISTKEKKERKNARKNRVYTSKMRFLIAEFLTKLLLLLLLYSQILKAVFLFLFFTKGLSSASPPSRYTCICRNKALTRSIDSHKSHLSLFVSPFLFFVQAMPAAAVSLQRKKSLPDVAQPIQLTATAPLSREEVSVLSSMRREEIRRQIDESERLRANPLLYLVSPQVKVSITLEIIFFFFV